MTVAVRGEVDLVTAEDLNAIVVTLAETGRQRVFLDLGACRFMGTDDLVAFAVVASPGPGTRSA